MIQDLAVGVSDLWCSHNRESLNWAFRAYDRFVGSLSPEIRERLAHKGQEAEAYVVVFGKTQVGKTTLLMDLMGVSNAAMERVSTVLRGGRAQGRSATATTMEYRRSKDFRWGLCLEGDSRWFDDDSAVTSALGELRDKMQCGELITNSPCVVSIPSDCFAIQPEHALRVRMLDLPGDEPSNQAEQEHVNEMARRYVPLADLILLVGRGDDLSFLQPGGLTLPGIEDWQTAPNRFRIITTYSFTAQSVRELTDHHAGSSDGMVYRERLVGQIERFAQLGREAKQVQRFFPLEFGKSWLDAKQRRPELYGKLAPVIEGFKRELYADIESSTTPMARLNSAVGAHVVIAMVKSRRLQEMKSISSPVEEQLRRAREDLSQARAAQQHLEHDFQLNESRLAKLTDAMLTQTLSESFSLFGETDPGVPGESVPAFRYLISRAKASLSNRVADSRPRVASTCGTAWFWRGVVLVDSSKVIDRLLVNAFDDFESHLNGYVLDKYWFTGEDSDYRKDVRRLKRCIALAESELVESLRKLWLEAAKQHLASLFHELDVQRVDLQVWNRRTNDLVLPVSTLEYQLMLLDSERQQFEMRMEKDLQEAWRFIRILGEEYCEELRQRCEKIWREPHAVVSLLSLLAATSLSQVRQRLLRYVESTDLDYQHLQDRIPMDTQQDIERHERELKELLQRVMLEPLRPINDSVQEVDKKLDLMEQAVQELRDCDVAALSRSSDESSRQLRSIKSIAEGMPGDVRTALDSVLKDTIATLVQSQHVGLEQVRSNLEQHSELRSRLLLDGLTVKLARQAKEDGEAINRLHESFSSCVETVSQTSSAQFESIAKDVSQLQSDLALQAARLAQLQQHHIEISGKHSEQLSNALSSIKKQLTIGFAVLSVGLVGGILMLLVRQA